MTTTKIVTHLILIFGWIAVLFSLAFAALPACYRDGLARPCLSYYGVEITDLTGGHIAFVPSTRHPSQAERVKYIPGFPSVFVFSSEFEGFSYFCFSGVCLAMGALLFAGRRKLLKDEKSAEAHMAIDAPLGPDVCGAADTPATDHPTSGQEEGASASGHVDDFEFQCGLDPLEADALLTRLEKEKIRFQIETETSAVDLYVHRDDEEKFKKISDEFFKV
jgi:hypothetical protein